MKRVLLVSKPVQPPWNDSSKNLARDFALGATRYRPVVLTRPGSHAPSESARSWGGIPPEAEVEQWPVYRAEGAAFSPPILDQVSVLGALAFDGVARQTKLWSFFFAPNPKTAKVAKISAKLARKRSVHIVCSEPSPQASLENSLFADLNIVLSERTRSRFEQEGFDAVRIDPAISPLEPIPARERLQVRERLGLPADRPLVVFAGDLCTGGGGERILAALHRYPDGHLVMATRDKTSASQEKRDALKREYETLSERISWLGNTPDILSLLGAADIVALPTDSLYAKMDYPLVLLEAMAMGVPVLVTRGTPAEELESAGAKVCDLETAEIAKALAAGVRSGVDAENAKRVASRFSRQRMAKSYESLFDSLL